MSQLVTYTIPPGEKRAEPILLPTMGLYRVEVAAGSRVELVAALVGEGRMAIDVELLGPGAEIDIDALLLVKSDERASIEIDIDHLHPDCRSRTLVKGIASDRAVGRFTGRIHVAPDAQRTEAIQQSRNILLSDTARILTQPQLEIYADDVHCSHGATVGQPDPEAIYYMRQRGLDIHTAHQLLLEGFIANISRFIDVQLDF